jgi:ubiquinone biosynthesis protein UbiJ
MTDPATALGRGIANRLLEGEDWAREKLRAHAGRTFSVSSGPIVAKYVVRPDGTLDALSGSVPAPDVELRVSPLDVPPLLADPSRWSALVTSTGDAELAETLKSLALTLPWFVERAFASAFGPIVGQRLADAGRRILGFPEYATTRLGESVVSYARDEAGLLARSDEARTFAEQNAILGARAEALEQRVERLQAAFAAPPESLG